MKIKIGSKFTYKSGSLYTFINPFSFYILTLQKNAGQIFENFILHPDGISIAKLLALLCGKVKRVSFDDTSIAPEVFSLINKENLTLGMLGSSKESIENASQIIGKKYDINNITVHDGYFSPLEAPRVLEGFLNCDVVICSMGTPQQENMLINLRNLGWQGTGFTCGGYFDQLSSTSGNSYYPELINKFHLRWAYRIYKEPRRLWRRYLFDYPKGIFALLRKIELISII